MTQNPQGSDRMTRYIEAFSWTKDIDAFIREIVVEKPLLNVCAGRVRFGDVTVDRYEPADYKADMTNLPFENDSFGAVFCDPPWDATVKRRCAELCKEALRVAPVLYLMAPWIWGTSVAELEQIWVRQFPGVNTAILLVKYRRKVPAENFMRMKEASLFSFDQAIEEGQQ